jgi:hypothetical protein
MELDRLVLHNFYEELTMRVIFRHGVILSDDQSFEGSATSRDVCDNYTYTRINNATNSTTTLELS